MNNVFKDIIRFLTDRLFITFIIMSGAFYFLTVNLFNLQIVNGESYQGDLRITMEKEISIPAPRGAVYDKFGRPLAVNESAFTVTLDSSIQNLNDDRLNTAIYDLMNLLEEKGEKYIDNFPISKEEPYTFEFSGSSIRENNWRRDMNITDSSLDAAGVVKYLREMFEIPGELTNSEARKILAIRSDLFLKRFKQYSPITIAVDVKLGTVAALEEESDKYPGVNIDVEALRIYPAGKYMSHILGYIGTINDTELAQYEEPYGYSASDIIGKTGIEKSFELSLRGTDGKRVVEVDGVGRRINRSEENQIEPVQGDGIFLTVDLDFQRKTYDILENMLKKILVNKLSAKSTREAPITVTQLLSSMVMSNNISIKKIWTSDDSMYSYQIKEYVQKAYPEADASTSEGMGDIKQVMADGIEKGKLSPMTMLLCMHEQGIITGDESYIQRLKKGGISPLQAIIEKVHEDEITPQMVNLDPCSGSVIVVDIHNGDVLASATYPTYDTNELVNNFNNEYYYSLNNDPTRPMYNRPFMERRAPGSTFKMITAVAGLETGVITPTSTIYDETTFTKAGSPYTSCWSLSNSHGSINVSKALEVSCNYFFFETAYRMGNAKNGNPMDSIHMLNEYMIDFGLNDRTGVEIGEAYDTSIQGILNISSPEFKEYQEKSRNPDASPSKYYWSDGDTIRTAIGQSKNNYTAANMVKYIATLANGGYRYQLHFMDKVESSSGELIQQFEPNLEIEPLELNSKTWEAVYRGMRNVTTVGTGRSVFADFPIAVAGKTGTAQEDAKRNEHTSFAGFAPYENPQIAVYVVIPFGDTLTTPSAASQVGRDVIGEYMGLNTKPQKLAAINVLSE